MRYKLYVGNNMTLIGNFNTLEEVKAAVGRKKNFDVLDTIEKKYIKI